MRQHVGRPEWAPLGHDRDHIKGPQCPDHGDHNGDECGGLQLRHNHIPQHLPPLRTIQARGLNLVSGDVVQARKVQDHAIRNLRPQTRSDDAVGGPFGTGQNVRCGARAGKGHIADDVNRFLAKNRLPHRAHNPEVRVVEPAKNQADNDLGNHEWKEEHGLVEPHARDRLVQEQRDEKAQGHGQHIQDQPGNVVAQRGPEIGIVPQLDVVLKPDPGRGGIAIRIVKAVPLIKRQPERFKDRDNHINGKEDERGDQENPRGHRQFVAGKPAWFGLRLMRGIGHGRALLLLGIKDLPTQNGNGQTQH
mmetsp:Transcript_23679/g.42238  ORF Transcript_23679/g.42238 Transcript_23679/m.42238 type:complete len:305 (-) Transcript_23679:4041-4955(-)